MFFHMSRLTEKLRFSFLELAISGDKDSQNDRWQVLLDLKMAMLICTQITREKYHWFLLPV